MADKIDTDELDKLTAAVSEHTEKIAPKEPAKAGRPSTVEESEQIVSTLVAGGGLPMPEEVELMEVSSRREQVWRLHLKGVNKAVIAKFFGVSETTIYKDIKKHNEAVQGHLTSLGAAGVIVESYSWYEQLRGESMRLLDLLDDAIPEGATAAQIGSVIKDKLPLMRLARDIEDSKMRMLMGIGLVPKTKEKEPLPALTAEYAVEHDSHYSTDEAKALLEELLEQVVDGRKEESGTE